MKIYGAFLHHVRTGLSSNFALVDPKVAVYEQTCAQTATPRSTEGGPPVISPVKPRPREEPEDAILTKLNFNRCAF